VDYLAIFVRYGFLPAMRAFITILLALFFVTASAQTITTRAELEKERQNIMAAIRETEEQLEATKKSKTATMGQLRALQSKLAERQRLIRNINADISQLNSNIQASSQEVSKLKTNLEALKLQYAGSVRYAYKSRSSYDMLAFLFSSDDFNEALRRLKYLKKYRDFRKRQADEIRIAQGEITRKIDKLNLQKSEKDVLLTSEVQQKAVLQNETNETDAVVQELKGKEKQLVAEIEKKRRATKQLDRAVAEIIRKEMEIARKKAEEEQRRRLAEERRRQEEEARRLAMSRTSGISVPPGSATRPGATTMPDTRTPGTSRPATSTPSTTTETRKPVASNYNYSLTPEAAALSSSFENNRGRLPWPVEKGFISEGFGRHQHPVAEKVMVENNGVDIRTSAGASARAVFDGRVSKVFYVPGLEWNVIVMHGGYFTLYSRLTNVTVKQDQEVRTKQPLGTVGINDEGESVMNFQIWKGASKMDPSGWIAR
jgi:septal ring factor EnvC (AmiA/AmiB activator)